MRMRNARCGERKEGGTVREARPAEEIRENKSDFEMLKCGMVRQRWIVVATCVPTCTNRRAPPCVKTCQRMSRNRSRSKARSRNRRKRTKGERTHG